MTIFEFARLVLALRTEQKAAGTGYKPIPAGAKAKEFEVEVDKAITKILNDRDQTAK